MGNYTLRLSNHLTGDSGQKRVIIECFDYLTFESVAIYKESDPKVKHAEIIVETLNKHLGVEKTTTETLLAETVKKMCDTLQHVYDNEDLKPNDIQAISEDLDYVQVNFFRTPPDGDYQHEVRTDTGISALDAINLLSVRIENTINSII